MFFSCFLCSLSFLTIALLRHHVYKHDLLSIKEFQCKQDGCNKRYESLSVLFKHLSNIHNIGQREQEMIPDDNFEQINSIDHDLSHDHDLENYDLTSEAANTDISLDLEYLLGLYSHSNFNRKDIMRIVNKTSTWAEKRFGVTSFEDLDTEYKVIKNLKSLGLWIEPVTLNFDYVETVSKKIKV